MKKKGFTLIELIVVMVVIGVLVVLGSPKYKEYVKEARIIRLTVEAKELELASQKYYMVHSDWPRLNDEVFSSKDIEEFSEKVFNKTGKIVSLDASGNYYSIGYGKLSSYIGEPKYKENYILQNPVGSVYYLDNLTDIGKEKLVVAVDLDIDKDLDTDKDVPSKKPIIFSGLPEAAFDKDASTTINLAEKNGNYTITWEGDLTNKVVYFDMNSYYETSPYGISVYDNNNNELSFLTNTGNQLQVLKSSKTRSVLGIVIPENASYIKLKNIINMGNSGTVYDIYEATDLQPPQSVTDLSATPDKTKVTLTWKNPTDLDYKTSYILRDGIKIGESSTGSFTDLTGLWDNTNYIYEVIAVDTTGNVSKSTILNVKTLDRSIKWSGFNGNPKAFDMIPSTTVDLAEKNGDYIITWVGDLANKVVYFDMKSYYETSPYSISVYDSNNTELSFLTNTGNQLQVLKSSKTRSVLGVVIPENASYIRLRNVVNMSNSGILYDIYEATDLQPPQSVTDLSATPDKTKVTLTWKNPTDLDYKTSYILRDGIKIGESSTSSFTDLTGLWANTSYIYEVIAVDIVGNTSKPTTLNVKTLDRDIKWSGFNNNPKAFDMIPSTTVDLAEKSGNYTITWEGDLTNKVVYFDMKSYYNMRTYGISVYDSNDNILEFVTTKGISTNEQKTSNVRTTYGIKIPENASYILIKNESGWSNSGIVYDIYEEQN